MVRRGSISKKGKPSSSDSSEGTGSPASARRTRRSSGEHSSPAKPSPEAEAAAPSPPPPPTLAETQEEQAKREEIFKIMRDKTDLPSVYGILEVAKEYFPKEKRSRLPKEDKTLLDQAEIAVSYLMFKALVDHFSRPLTVGGLALSDARSNEVAKKVFKALGPASCLGSVSESRVMKKAGLSRGATRKVMSHLKQIGEEARSEVGTMRKEILPDMPKPVGKEADIEDNATSSV